MPSRSRLRSGFVAGSLRAAFLVAVAAAWLSSFRSWAVADDLYWVALSGDWSNAQNWQDVSNPGGSPPTFTDRAYIANGGTATISAPGAVCDSLWLSDGSVQMTGGNLQGNEQFVQDGSFSQSGGTNSGYVTVGGSAGYSGTYVLSGSGRLNTGDLGLGGNGGAATFTQNGGINNAGEVDFSSGTYNLNAGLLTTWSLWQNSGSATFNFKGGTLQAAGASFSGNAPITLVAGGSGAIFDPSGYSMKLSCPVSGSGGLTLSDSSGSGTGSLVLAGTNTYSGATQVSRGFLQVVNSAALGSSSQVTVVPGGALALSGGVAVGSIPLSITGTGCAGSGALTTTGVNSYAGPISVGPGGPNDLVTN